MIQRSAGKAQVTLKVSSFVICSRCNAVRMQLRDAAPRTYQQLASLESSFGVWNKLRTGISPRTCLLKRCCTTTSLDRTRGTTEVQEGIGLGLVHTWCRSYCVEPTIYRYICALVKHVNGMAFHSKSRSWSALIPGLYDHHQVHSLQTNKQSTSLQTLPA